MLVQFKLKNFGSFRDETVLDMRAIKAYKEHPENCIRESEKESFLKVAALYGANACGKSNFVLAYSYFLNIVRRSFSGKEKQEKESVLEQNYNPFLFDPEQSEYDTEFEAIFHKEGVEYRYGFVYDNKKIKYEWLYKAPLNQERKVMTTILERTQDTINLGSSIKTSCEKYLPSIDQDVLALSFFSSLKLRSKVFRETLYCITDFLPMQFTCEKTTDEILNHYFSEEFNEEEKANLLRFLSAIDIGIKDLEVKKTKNAIDVYSFHRGQDGALYRAPFEIESDGTRKAIAVYTFARIAVSRSKGLIIDELNMQLHPLLLKYIVDLFYIGESSGQLIYTTHDTTLLDKKYMRRDQIWFVKKDDDGASSIVSLAEYKIRNDSSFEKAYLGGSFGAVPNLSDFSFKGE